MRKILILLCAVAFLGLTLSAPYAEAQEETGTLTGYNVRRATATMKVAQYANNALVNNLTFRRTTATDPNIADAPSGEDLTIKIGYGLLMTNEDSVRAKATAKFTLWCDNNDNSQATDGDGYEADCEATATATDGDGNIDKPKATFSNEGGTGVITITIGTALESFVVAGVRVDASGLAVKDEITASVTSTTDASSVGLGGGSTAAGVSGLVGVVSDGLKVTAAKDADLACSAATPAPSITVAEGYTMAWGPTRINMDEVGGAANASGASDLSASVKIYLDNLPDDAKVEWPGTVNSLINIAASGAAKDERINGTLTMDAAESSTNGKVVVYNYTRVTMTASGNTDDPDTTDMDESMMAFTAAQNNAARSFTITPTKTTFKGDASVDVAAALSPGARRGTDGEKLNLDTELSFEHPLEAPEKGNGDGWLVISECVTYLLYPFVTCGATPGWSTGISDSNTTADANVFGAFDNTAEQDGGVVLFGFPKDRMLSAVEGDEEPTVEAIVDTISDDLKAGETMTFDCGNSMMAGMEGYAIIRAGFQHARGMAFVLGNFTDGAAVDVSHGYMAEVIDNPATRSDKLD